MTDATVVTSRDRFHAVAADAPTGARVPVEERILVDERDLMNAVRREEHPLIDVSLHLASTLTGAEKEVVRNFLGICRLWEQ